MLCPHPCYEAQGGGNANGQEGLHVMVHYDLSNLFEKSRSLWCFNPLLSEAKNNAVWSDNDGFVSCDTAYVNLFIDSWCAGLTRLDYRLHC